jgi:hypothetical protein
MGQESSGDIVGVSPVTALHKCKSLTDSLCSASKAFFYESLFDKCSQELLVDCVSDVTAINAEGKTLKVNFLSEYPGARPDDFREIQKWDYRQVDLHF